MVGSFLPAHLVLRRIVAVLALATVVVPASASTAAAAPPEAIETMNAQHIVQKLRENARGAAPAVFATVDGQELVLPGAVLGVGFHESGSGTALAMSPVGQREGKVDPAAISQAAASGDAAGTYMVLPTRHRGRGATTAVDISMPETEQVISPVTGTVKAASPYNLYGTSPDMIVEIEPEGRPELLVRVMHLDGVELTAGDKVQAGKTVVAAQSRRLPFPSQIDRYAGEHPHVHIEVWHRV